MRTRLESREQWLLIDVLLLFRGQSSITWTANLTHIVQTYFLHLKFHFGLLPIHSYLMDRNVIFKTLLFQNFQGEMVYLRMRRCAPRLLY